MRKREEKHCTLRFKRLLEHAGSGGRCCYIWNYV